MSRQSDKRRRQGSSSRRDSKRRRDRTGAGGYVQPSGPVSPRSRKGPSLPKESTGDVVDAGRRFLDRELEMRRRRSRRKKKRRAFQTTPRGGKRPPGVDLLKASTFGKPMFPRGILPIQETGFGAVSGDTAVTDFVKSWLPPGEGWVLDLDGMRHIDLCLYVVSIGYHLVSCGLAPYETDIDELAYIRYVQEDLLQWGSGRKYDQVLNLLAVSYRLDSDLQVMQKLRALMRPNARQYLMVPVGRDTIVAGKYIVYGERLKELLAGYSCSHDKYWRRQAGGWEECGKARAVGMLAVEGDEALRALGGFILQRKD